MTPWRLRRAAPVVANVAAASATTGTIANTRRLARVVIPDMLLPPMRPREVTPAATSPVGWRT